MLTKNIEDKEKIDRIINECQTCYVGVVDLEGKPYVVPMNFGYDGEVIILHSGPDGGLLHSVKQNPEICVTFSGHHEIVYQSEQVACSYRMKSSSVICRGTVRFEEDLEKKKQYLNILMKQYVDKEFSYSLPALKNVVVWIIDIYDISSKVFGASHPNSKKYNEGDELFN